LVDDSGEGDDGSKEFAGQFDTGVFSGHRFLSHGRGFIAEDVFPEAGSGSGHFGEAGNEGDDEIPKRKAFLDADEEGQSDGGIEEEPEEGIEGGIVEGRSGVDLGIDVVSLEPGEEEKEDGEDDVDDRVEEFHDARIDD